MQLRSFPLGDPAKETGLGLHVHRKHAVDAPIDIDRSVWSLDDGPPCFGRQHIKKHSALFGEDGT